MELREIRPLAIQRWIQRLRADLAPNTVQVTFTNFSTILNAAVADELIARNPAASRSVTKPLPVRRRVIPWTVDQVRAVIDAHPDRYRVMIAVAAGAGLRQSELFGLAPDDIDLDGLAVHVSRQVKFVYNKFMFAPPKYCGDEDPARIVPVSAGLAALLRDHIARFAPVEVTLPWRDPAATRTATASLIFTSREHRALNKNYVNAFIWKPALAQAGMPTDRCDHNGMHDVRHFCASNWLEHGV